MTFENNAAKAKKSVECFYEKIEVSNVSPARWGIRHLQAFLLFLALLVSYGMRAAMGVALVAMTSDSSSSPDVKKFNWDKTTQDVIMSSFFWGYMVMQLPAGQISIKYGGKYPIFFSLVANGVLSCLIPFIAQMGGWKATCAIRVIQGATQGVLMPCIHGLLGRWSPAEERGRLGTFVHGGSFLGSVVFMSLAGLLSSTSFGWPSVFYVLGGISLMTAILWHVVGANSPSDHKYITEKERFFIQTSIGENCTKKLDKVPWRCILTSAPVWAVCVGHIGHSWGQITLMTQTPAYLTKVLQVNIRESGSLSALPFLAKWVSLILFGFLFDYLVNSGLLNRLAARKLAQTIGSWPVAAGMILLAYAPQNIVYVEVILIAICSLFSAQGIGCLMNHLDLSPNYCGTLMSLSNFCANLVSIFAPITAGLILTDDSNAFLWRKVFFISAGMFIGTNLIYVILGQADVMPWDDPDYTRYNKDEKFGFHLEAVMDHKPEHKTLDKESKQDDLGQKENVKQSL